MRLCMFIENISNNKDVVLCVRSFLIYIPSSTRINVSSLSFIFISH